MKIRTQFLISLVIFAVVAVITGGSFFFADAELSHAGDQEIIANNTSQGATELGYLANDYLLNGEPQQLTRWETRLDQLTSALDQIDTSNTDTATLVGNIKTNLRSLETVFTDISNTIINNPMTDPATHLAFVQVSWSRLEVPIQSIVFDAAQLPHIFEDRSEQVQRQQTFLLIAMLTVIIGYFVVNYFLVSRRVLRSMAEIQTGARFIGSGNLDYAIPEKYDDEIGDLARSFNRMTANLKTITASKSDLEKEMYKRAEAEEELRIANEELNISNENLQDNAQKLEHEMEERTASEERFRGLFQKAPYAVALSSIPDGIYTDVNEAFIKMTGFAREEIIGNNSGALRIFRDSESRARVIEELQANGSVQFAEAPIFTKSGEKRIVTTNVEKVTFQGRDYWLNMSLDITEKKKADDLLQTTLQRFYLMLGSMYAGVLLMTEDGTVEFVNQSFCDAYGLKETPDRLRGVSSPNLLAMIKPAFRFPEQEEARIREILQRMEPVSGEQFELINGRTAIRDFTPIMVGGKAFGRIWTHTDITKLKKVERELAGSNQKISEILASIQDSFYALDHDWNFVYANDRLTSGIGKKPEDFIGHNFWVMFPKNKGTLVEENFRAAMESRELRRFEMAGQYTQAWYRLTVFPSAEGITVIGEDITDIKKAEESLRESYSELERIGRAAVNRELRMIELKKEINRYYIATGQPPRYILDPDEGI